MKIEKITPEQEAKIPIYLKRYFDKVYSSKPIIKEDAKTSIEYIYNNAGYKTPFIWHCDSPLMMQIIGNLFTNKDIRDNLGTNLRDNLEANLWDNLGDNIKYIPTSYYGNLSNYGWTCFYDFINNELIPSYNLELWDKWKMLINSNVYDMIQLDELCIVCSMPNIVLIDMGKRIHSENSCSVHFKDGYEIYSWHGIIIPKLWITQKDLITKDVILNKQNAEKRRVLQEILGSEEYCKRLDCVIVDT